MDRSGIVWYIDQANSTIGRLDPATGQVQVWTAPTERSIPYGLTAAPDGMLWIGVVMRRAAT